MEVCHAGVKVAQLDPGREEGDVRTGSGTLKFQMRQKTPFYSKRKDVTADKGIDVSGP